ncbi:Alpha-glucosidase 2-like [Abeliophyllum distichum]|uniref:Alpha-glucosidase 2-like n=1 Tax=Abeliophyllum distichum TaxID=126358 RepID=A0ABD1NSA6_9LAMI
MVFAVKSPLPLLIVLAIVAVTVTSRLPRPRRLTRKPTNVKFPTRPLAPKAIRVKCPPRVLPVNADPKDFDLRTHENSFLLGPLLVYASTRNDDQELYQIQHKLPKGMWLSFDFEDSHPDLPSLYLKGGSIIPLAPPYQHVDEANPTDDISLLVALDEHVELQVMLTAESANKGSELSRTPVEIKNGDWALKVVPWMGGRIISMEHLPSGLFACAFIQCSNCYTLLNHTCRLPPPRGPSTVWLKNCCLATGPDRIALLDCFTIELVNTHLKPSRNGRVGVKTRTDSLQIGPLLDTFGANEPSYNNVIGPIRCSCLRK